MFDKSIYSIKPSMKFLLLLQVYLFASMALVSCGKEKAQLSDGVVSRNDARTMSASCKSINLHQNVLNKQNILNIFDCVGWSDEFPETKSYFESIEEQKLNQLLLPFDKAFFKNINRRDDFLKFVVSSYSRDEINKISEFTKKIFEEKKALKLVLKLIENEETFLPNTQTLIDTLKLVRNLTAQNENQRSALKEILIKSKKKSKAFNFLYQKLTKELGVALFTNDNPFVSSIPLFVDDGVWLNSFIQKYDTKQLSDLITYINSDPDLYEHLNFIKAAILNNSYSCTDYNRVYFMNYQEELQDRLSSLASKSKENFLLDLFELSQRFSLFNNICPYQKFNHVSSKVLHHLRSYVLAPGGYDFLSSLARLSVDLEDEYLIFNIMNSELFIAFSSFFEYDKKDHVILKHLQDVFKTYNSKTYQSVSSAAKSLAKDPFYLQSNFGSALTSEDKAFVVKFVTETFLLENNTATNANGLLKLLAKFPDLYEDVSNNLHKHKEAASSIFTYFVSSLENPVLVKEFKSFWSEKTFFKLIFILMDLDKPVNISSNSPTNTSVNNEPLVVIGNDYESLYTCLEQFHELSQDSYDFWYLLDHYPKACAQITQKQSMASYIFQWTVSIDQVFYNNFGTRFSVKYGMISPEMMSFYNQLMQIINTHVDHHDNYIRDVVEKIKEELFTKGLAFVLDDFNSVLKSAIEHSSFATKAFKQMAKVDSVTFDNVFKDFLSLFSSPEAPALLNEYSCSEVSSKTGGIACPNKNQNIYLFKKLKELFIRDTGANKKLYEEFIDFLMPQVGIKIPYEAKKQRKKSFDLDEVVRFVFDLTKKDSIETITFKNKEGQFDIDADNSHRLEIVIREISFLNNFYGAFFMNSVSRAKDYHKKVKSLKEKVKLMDKTSGFFRNRGIFPSETKWNFKNIIETYDSLIEVGNKHIQYDGTTRSYGDLTQALLTMVVKTSSPYSQKYSPFQTPKPRRVDLHNGEFITEMTNFTILSHLGNWIRKISDNNIKNIVEHKKFITVRKNFISLFTPIELKNLFQLVLTHKSTPKIFSDFLDGKDRLTGEDYNRVLNIIFNSVYILSNINESIKLTDLQGYLMAFLDLYEQINLKVEAPKSGIIRLVDEVVDSMAKLNVQQQKSIFDTLSGALKLISVEEFKKILTDKELNLKILKFANSFLSYLDGTRHNSGFLKRLIADADLNFASLHKMITDVVVENKDLDYFKNIITALAIAEDNKSHLIYSLEELFIKKDQQIIEFLTDIFNKFSRQNQALKP